MENLGAPDEMMEEEQLGFIDLSKYKSQSQQADDEEFNQFLQQSAIDMQNYASSSEPQTANLWNYARDFLVQGSLGVASAFSWPADFLKLAMMGEALDPEDLVRYEEIAQREGVPFDRTKYIKSVASASEFIPTQELLERGISAAGFDLQPKTDLGKKIRQFFTIATFNKGSLARRATAGATAALTTSALESAGVNDTAAAIAGDVVGLAAGSIGKKVPKVIDPETERLLKFAEKAEIPFYEGMLEAGKPAKNAKISERNATILKQRFDKSVEDVIDNVLANKISVKQLRDAGVDLEAMAADIFESVKDEIREIPFSVAPMVDNIDYQIIRIREKAPVPAEADVALINKLQNIRSGLVEGESKIAKTITGEQLINQYQNFNRDLKVIYKSPEFSGKENTIRTGLEELKEVMIRLMENEGSPEAATLFRKGNSIWKGERDLTTAEGIIGKFIVDGQLQPGRLRTMLRTRDGKMLGRIIGPDGIQTLENISKIADRAETNIFKAVRSGLVTKEDLLKLGGLMAFVMKVPASAKLGIMTTKVAPYVRGHLLTRPATRIAYENALQSAARNDIKAFKADMDRLNQVVINQFGSIDELVDQAMDGVPIFTGEDD